MWSVVLKVRGEIKKRQGGRAREGENREVRLNRSEGGAAGECKSERKCFRNEGRAMKRGTWREERPGNRENTENRRERENKNGLKCFRKTSKAMNRELEGRRGDRGIRGIGVEGGQHRTK